MAWRYSKAGKAISYPSSEDGLYVEGPLTTEVGIEGWRCEECGNLWRRIGEDDCCLQCGHITTKDKTMRLGTFKGKGVKGTEQYGDTTNGYPQIALTMRMAIDGGTQDATTYLIFSPESAPYSLERLRALGWKGSDLSQELVGIDANEVDINVRSEEYQGKTQIKCDIVAGGGVVKLSKPISREAFAAKVKAIAGGGAAPSAGGAKPPF